MAAEVQSVVNRLSRLNKNELIDIIVYRKIPENLIDCDVLKYIKQSGVENVQENEEKEKFTDAQETVHECCPSLACARQKCKSDFMEKELTTKNLLITHLESRINEQSDIIKVFKTMLVEFNGNVGKVTPTKLDLPSRSPLVNTNKNTVKNTGVNTQNRTTSAEKLNTGSTLKQLPGGSQNTNTTGGSQKVMPQSYKQFSRQEVAESIKEAQTILPTNNQEIPFTEVVRRKNRPKLNKPIIGNNNDTVACGLRAGNILSFLHVYGLHPDMTTEELTKFLQQAFSEATCEKLKSQYPDIYSSFKVVIHEKHLNMAMDASFWPRGVRVNRFFHKRRNLGAVK